MINPTTHHDPVQRILDALKAAGRKVRGTGRDRYECQCPAHDDRQASLSLSRGDDGKVLLHCHAGCTFNAVVGALGLAKSDLQPGGNSRSDRGEIVATYEYHDEGGELLYQVVRFMPKDFRQRRPDGSGGWIWNMQGVRRVLYRLPDLLEHPDVPVWIVEGEKDADALWRCNRVATCNVGGAGKWRDEYNDHLQGVTAYIIGDNDDAGRKHAAAVAKHLTGVAASVRIVPMPDTYSGHNIKDVSDWLNAGGTVEHLEEIATTEFPQSPTTTTSTSHVFTRLSDVQPQPVRWLWPDRIALGKLTVLAGDPGLGKSFSTLDMTARITQGTPWPDRRGEPGCPGSAVLMNAEDDLADTIRPRLDAAGADPTKVIALTGVKTGDGESERSVTLADVDAIEGAIRELPDCRLVVVDPVSAYLAGIDGRKNADTRGLLAPLAALAGKYGVAVVMVTHLNKSGGARALYRAMDSLAFVAAARAAYLVTADKADPQRRLFLPMKNNLGVDNSGLAYRLIDGAVAWEPDPVGTSADEALAADADREGGQAIKHECAEWLRELLTPGPVASTEVEAEAKAAGYTRGTLRRARELLTIKVYRATGSTSSPWFWRLKG